MAVKLIAVDMDGTFLNNQKEYDRKRFAKAFQKMEEKGIRFVVASGNQYFQLRSFFPEYDERISFVSENGANIILGRSSFYHGQMEPGLVQQVLQVIEKLEPKNLILCGKNSAYVSEDISPETLALSKIYYPEIQKVADFNEIEDTLFKIALSFETEAVTETLAALEKVLAGRLVPVSSGHGDIDLIIPGIHKANGIKLLQKEWGIADEEVAAFGDSGNDYEMIVHAHHSFAMENGSPVIREAAKTIIGNNNTDTVLATIEKLIDLE
ncbi:Cof-type HAD-IIB family hydrolase [Enterococcus sp. LJL128]